MNDAIYGTDELDVPAMKRMKPQQPEPAYFQLGIGILFSVSIILSLTAGASCSFGACGRIRWLVSQVEPKTKYYDDLVKFGTDAQTAGFANGLIIVCGLIAVFYLILRIISEFVFHDTRVAEPKYVIVLFLITFATFIIYFIEDIDKTKSGVQLSIYHSIVQNVITINLVFSCFCITIGEMAAQYIAFRYSK